MHPNLKQIGLALWLPGLAGALTFAITWLQWFLIEPACGPTATAPCPLLPWGRYITREILSQCIIHTALVMTVTGGSDAMLFIQERKRGEELQKINEQKLADAREYYEKRLADDRESRAEELRLRAEEQQRYEQRLADDQQRYEQRLADDRELRAEELRLRAAEQQRYEQQLAADRERADRMAEKQEALLERTFQLLQEERNAAEAARAAAAEERRQQDDRIRRLEAQLAAQQPPQA